MADCSAVGTTIDRAARVVLGNSNQDVTKHVGALVGHAATVGSQMSAMPMAAPGHLALPGASRGAAPLMTVASSHTYGLPSNQQQQQMMMHPQHEHMMHQQHHQQQQQMAQAMYFQQQQHHQQHHQQQMMQQQQQQQQMQMMAAQQQQQQNQKQNQRQRQNPLSPDTNELLNNELQDDLEHWHAGLDEDVARQHYAEEEELLGHDGVVHGASIEELAAAWAEAEAEYDNLAEQDEDSDYANLFQGTNALQNETVRPYEFINEEDENAPSESMKWMEEGMRQFQEGNLKEAVRSFEMELQQNNPDNATAWRMLGNCHAENDMDPEAIKCLEAAVDRDPFSPESLLALGVSYVNELNHERALENMKAWCTHNPKYAGMDLPSDIYGAASSTPRPKESAFEEVKQLLLSAIAFDATDAGDVHEALGVILNVIKDYDAAAESFRKALESRPAEYQLWNKLGATLANGSHSDQALPAYHKALQLKPKYARAWLNMAISHSNLQDHDEAARCYLQTLSLNPGATHCWTYLRMALSCSERWDLLPLVFSQDLTAFRDHFEFVLDQN